MTLDVKKTRASRMDKKKSGIHLIAELANVSIGTVDRALHERRGIKEATRQHILQIARQIGYTPNLAARSLSVAKSSARVGVCIPREIHFFYDQLWSGVLEEARNVGQLGIQFENRPVQVLGEGDTAVFKDLVKSLRIHRRSGEPPFHHRLRRTLTKRQPRRGIDGQARCP